MSDTGSVKESFSISTDKAIEQIRDMRNAIISSLLTDEKSLHTFLEAHFSILALSAIKLEFLRRNLREHKASVLDLAHYSSLIKQLTDRQVSIIDESHPLFLNELKGVFQKGSIV